MERNYNIQQKYEGMTILQYVREVLLFTRRYTKFIKNNGGETFVNGEAALFHHVLKQADHLTIKIPNEQPSSQLIPEQLDLHIVYEDADILVVNKRAGMATIPSNKEQTGTIANGLFGYYQLNKLPYTVHIVTRLDRETSGLMLIAKHKHCHAILSRLQQKNEIYRSYVAIVEGHLDVRKDTIRLPIARAQDSIIKRVVNEYGQPAVTHYQVRDEYQDMSLVKVSLETGRTHQIRVHFSAIGHPLVGDTLYGSAHELITRQSLHSEELSFNHPFTNVELKFTQEIPSDMSTLIRECSEL